MMPSGSAPAAPAVRRRRNAGARRKFQRRRQKHLLKLRAGLGYIIDVPVPMIEDEPPWPARCSRDDVGGSGVASIDATVCFNNDGVDESSSRRWPRGLLAVPRMTLTAVVGWFEQRWCQRF